MKKQILFLLGFLLCCSFAKAQKNISGKVSGDDGNPIPGVSVRVKKSQTGIITDATGNFNLKASADDILTFSSVGYINQEAKVGNRSVINIVLTTNVSALEEVVVMGYGTQKRSSVTAAVASVGSKELTALPVPSIEGALQGRVSGVQVTSNGSPGVAPVVRIRGVGSINYAANPLYVIDGYPVGNLNDIDMKDVESLEVLKDASAAAIYGSRAANGVIIITTKKGSKDGKLHINVETYYASQSPWKKLTPLNTQQYLQYGKTLLSAAGAAFPDRWSQLNNETYPGSGVTFANTNTDWQDHLFQTGGLSNTTATITGGNATSRFLTSFGYFKQDGIYVGTNYERGNIRLNSDHSIGKYITIGQTLTIAMGSRLEDNANPTGQRTALANVIKNLPYTPVYNPTEIGGYYGTTNADGSDPVNPLIAAVLNRTQNRNTRLLGSIFAEIKFTDYLKYKFSVGLDYNNSRRLARTPIYTAGQSGYPFNSISDTRGEFIGTLYTNQLSFDKTFKKHSINAIVVAEQQFGTDERITAAGNYTTNTFTIVTPNVTSPAAGGEKSETTLLSYLGRVNYDYAGKYLLSASIRRDGSSLFAPGKKWGTFPAASIGWRISEEAFMKDIPAINELKVRASYGLVGNTSGLPNYAWQSLVGAATNYVFANGATPGLSTNQLGNSELGWETTKMSDIGLDLGLLKNKVTVSADYYIRETSDNSLILARPLASSLGYSNNTIANFGGMKNTGLDLQVNYNHSEGDFKWKVGGNLGIVRNTVTSLEAPIFAGGHAETGANVTKTEVGMPVQYLYGYVVDKIYQTQGEIDADDAQAKNKKWDSYQGGKAAPGDIRFKDLNGDGKIDDSDRTMIGNTLPDFTYGINFDANYKNFDFTLFLQGVQGNDIYNNLKTQTQGMVRLFGATTDVLNAWTPQNTNTNVPRAISGDPNGNTTRPSDRWIEKGSFMRVKNISLGYNVPASILKTFAGGTLTKVRVYVSAQNLLTFTNYSGYDPEIGSRDNAQLVYGIDNGQYPQARTLMAGLQLGF
ncbi:MAG: TonB-dependent receptor [Flectobacillus sp.]|nr:TonB-dependent receptor [Flectobacillus sp.]